MGSGDMLTPPDTVGNPNYLQGISNPFPISYLKVDLFFWRHAFNFLTVFIVLRWDTIFLCNLRYGNFFNMWFPVIDFSQVSVSYTVASFFSLTTAVNFSPFSSLLPSSAHSYPLWFPFGNHYAELLFTFFPYLVVWMGLLHKTQSTLQYLYYAFCCFLILM